MSISDILYSHAAILKRRASGYTRKAPGMVNADYIDRTIAFSAGAHSTTADLLRWERALFGGKLLTA